LTGAGRNAVIPTAMRTNTATMATGRNFFFTQAPSDQ
jgi:hypothetical protein